MNRECHGDWIPSMKMYRCLYDGRFVDIEKKPAICPNCKRNTIVPSIIRRPKLLTVVMQQVRIRKKYQTYRIEFNPVRKQLQIPSRNVKK